ncbi:hypothetical protein POPTR_010G121650v4 [Populus trichocarpa]|uniref:Uncharacterized protein n=1 Tax=Populus trichocarpa TaxID=3694 RepID=A0ACC0SD18_POPTR|nr:hypothetical protein POPTR_010G121650v4 [Populus trichocarpa]
MARTADIIDRLVLGYEYDGQRKWQACRLTNWSQYMKHSHPIEDRAVGH